MFLRCNMSAEEKVFSIPGLRLLILSFALDLKKQIRQRQRPFISLVFDNCIGCLINRRILRM